MVARNRNVDTPEKEQEFASDWNAGMPVQEMTEKYGFAHKGSIANTVKRLGLEPRISKSIRDRRMGLSGGSWQRNERGVMIWVPDK